jgi:hypothetical protein
VKPFKHMTLAEQRAHLDKINGRKFVLEILSSRDYSKSCGSAEYRPEPRTFSCGCPAMVVTVLRIPDELMPFCEERGWLTTMSREQGRVAVIRHPKLAQDLGPHVTPSDRCPECVMRDLRVELMRIKANVAAVQEADEVRVPPSHERPHILRGGRRRKSA